MDTIITISTWTGIIQYFLTIFTTPTAEIFTSLVTGWVLCTAKRTITGILPFANQQRQRPHDAYHRFFPNASWAPKPVVENADVASGQDISSQRCYTDRSGRHSVSSQWSQGQRSRLVARCRSFEQHQDRTCLGTESGGSYFENIPALGRRTSGIAHQYKTAQKERPNIDRFGRRDVGRSCPLAARKAVSLPLRRVLPFLGWTGYTQYTYNLSYASGCKYLRFAGKEENQTKGSSPQKRQEVACSRADGQASTKFGTGRDSRTRQNQEAIGLLEKGYLVQRIREAGIVGYQSGSEGQRERRFFLYHRFESQSRRGHRRFCRPMEYRGYIQEHKAVSRWPAAPDLEGQRPETSRCCELLALFGGVALVSAAEESQQNFSGSSLVSWQNLPELSGCFGLSPTRALETEN